MSPHGCQKMSAKPCKRDAEESLPVRRLSNQKPKPPNCLLIQDKTFYSLASIHTSEEFEERIPSWKKQGLILKYLPPYAPELNLIEILWGQIKYHWLPFSAYQCLNALTEALENILSNIGSKYQITFA